MGKSNDEFDIESVVDVNNVDVKAAEALLARGNREMRASNNVERVNSTSNEIEVEEVPDERVAPQDRTAKPLVETTSLEPTEEELAAYSDGVRKRFDQLTHARHDERREKENAQRERDEAVVFAQQVLVRQRALEEQAKTLAASSSTATLDKLTAEIAAAKNEYVEAANRYDTEAMAEAQMKMAALVSQKTRAEAEKIEKPVAQAQSDVVQRQVPARPAPDRRAQEWAARNDAWFQKDKAMTAFVFGVHEDLVGKGVDPRTDADLYYKKLDEEVKSRFPEKFEDRTQRTSRQNSPVVSAVRTVNGRKRVTLTTTEMSLARRLGVTPEQFAAEKIKLENRNG